ncbi:LytR/AlgR family response regulator transcription factor [Desertivirga arenae]|uniref:LytR/AlgR family response regulator transcription factor n=1 Tax=Desertivirga arenae TaxID=2810309 RepID=UPI001A957BEE|nr:LytTR family DNA-binding domain-containing protein [Pedobacter sp. SYSU D00823]
MAAIKCIAIDDEPLALDLIEDFCSKFPAINLVKTFEDALSAKEFLKSQKVDLIFLDINMPDISGIDFAFSLNDKPLIVFTTAYRDYAVEGFELNALDYLVKPFEFDRFAKAIERAVETKKDANYAVGKTANDFIYVSSEYKLVKIDLSEVDYLESMEDYIKIHLQGSKTIFTLLTMKALSEKLPMGRFIRIHRSYMVPIAHIKFIFSKRLVLNSGIELPIGKSYVDSVKDLTKVLSLKILDEGCL